MKYIEIQPEFNELLDYTQELNNAINPKSQQYNSASEDYARLNPQDFIKNERGSPYEVLTKDWVGDEV